MDKEAIVARIREVLRAHPRVLRAELFGSVARGEARPDSDVDLVMHYAPGTDILDTADVGADLEERLGRPVSLLSARVLENPPEKSMALLARYIEPDRELIYERKA